MLIRSIMPAARILAHAVASHWLVACVQTSCHPPEYRRPGPTGADQGCLPAPAPSAPISAPRRVDAGTPGLDGGYVGPDPLGFML